MWGKRELSGGTMVKRCAETQGGAQCRPSAQRGVDAIECRDTRA